MKENKKKKENMFKVNKLFIHIFSNLFHLFFLTIKELNNLKI